MEQYFDIETYKQLLHENFHKSSDPANLETYWRSDSGLGSGCIVVGSPALAGY